MASPPTTLPSTPSFLTRTRKTVQPFLLGGMCGCFATCCIQPIDMIKVRMQLLGEATAGQGEAAVKRSSLLLARNFIKTEGFFSLYRGLDAALLRQAVYTTARVGSFRLVSDTLLENQKKNYVLKGGDLNSPNAPKTLPLYKKFIAGLTAGGFGSFLGNPTDLILTRLQADSTLPPAERRNYKGAGDAFVRIIRNEGIFALWRGAVPTMLRAMALNTGQFATFDHTKELLTPSLGDGPLNMVTSSAIAGFFTATMSLPFDFLKTRIQKMKVDPATGKYPYKSTFDCAVKVARNEGLLRFYTGYPVYYFRVAPHAMIVLLSYDTVSRMLKRNGY